MNPLLELDRRHSFLTSLLGGGSGAFAWIVAHSQDITHLASMIGAIAGAAIAVLTLLVKLWSLTCHGLAWWRRRQRTRAARAQHTAAEQDFRVPDEFD